MMQRNAMNELIKWKENEKRKPLIIRGARQVGKTWLMKTFGEQNYDNFAYINFESNERMHNLFQGDLSIPRIIMGLQIESGIAINPRTLIIFDEVQEVPNALTSLKYFQENAPEYQVIAAGSVLGVALHGGTSYPVGKVEFLDLHPLTFLEFLKATDNGQLVELLYSKDVSLINSFKNKLIDLLKTYYFVGGMPEVVSAFVSGAEHITLRDVQLRLLRSYEQDFSKHVPFEIVPRVRLVWNSIPSQLSKENRKFIFGLVKQGARAREYELALQWLIDSGLIFKVYRVSKPEIPLKAYQDVNAFKLFMVDVGLLGALSGLDMVTLLEGDRVFTEFRGALTEQYVHQQLTATNATEPYYWSADKGMAEVDFVIQHQGEVIPVEVKAAENLKAKSLKIYHQEFSSRKSIRTSLSEFRDEGWLINLPLYMINTFQDYLS